MVNSYYKQGRPGTLPTIYLREYVAKALQKVQNSLQEGYSLIIFDGFRSRQTQLSLFEEFRDNFSKKYPHHSQTKILDLTREFVAHPDEPSRFKIAPHNSGGAVDVSISYNGLNLDMGTDFDDLSNLAQTTYFEGPNESCPDISQDRWDQIKKNRRLLYNSMIKQGFVNYSGEWWHYDLGDAIWAQEVGSAWEYDSMEKEVVANERNV